MEWLKVILSCVKVHSCFPDDILHLCVSGFLLSSVSFVFTELLYYNSKKPFLSESFGDIWSRTLSVKSTASLYQCSPETYAKAWIPSTLI